MCQTFVSKHAIRAVSVALMSLGMTFSFNPEFQITINCCKNTMKYTGVTLGSIISCLQKVILEFSKRKMNQSILRKIESLITQASLAAI